MTDSLSKEEMQKVVQEVLDKMGPVKLISSHTAHMYMAHYTEPESIACKWCGSKDCFLQVGIPHFCRMIFPAPVGKIKLT